MVVEHAPLEDELGDVLEKAMRHAGLNEQVLSGNTGIDVGRIRDAFDYRYDLTADEIRRLAVSLSLNEVGLGALAAGCYPLPEISGLPFCLYPLRTGHGIGVANAYLVADCARSNAILFDAGVSYPLLRRVWPRNITQVDAVFVTHVETEHVGGLAAVLDHFGPVPVFGPACPSLPGAVALGEAARVSFGPFEVEALHTSGHAAAHNCYVVRTPRLKTARPLLVSGDLFFAGSIGGGYSSISNLRSNVRRLFESLGADTVVAPGHGPLTTIQNERRFNPFVASDWSGR